jgi:hypothetical protein
MGRLGSWRPLARREGTGRLIVVQMTAPLNTRAAQICTLFVEKGHAPRRRDDRIAAPKEMPPLFDVQPIRPWDLL